MKTLRTIHEFCMVNLPYHLRICENFFNTNLHCSHG